MYLAAGTAAAYFDPPPIRRRATVFASGPVVDFQASLLTCHIHVVELEGVLVLTIASIGRHQIVGAGNGVRRPLERDFQRGAARRAARGAARRRWWCIDGTTSL